MPDHLLQHPHIGFRPALPHGRPAACSKQRSPVRRALRRTAPQVQLAERPEMDGLPTREAAAGCRSAARERTGQRRARGERRRPSCGRASIGWKRADYSAPNPPHCRDPRYRSNTRHCPGTIHTLGTGESFAVKGAGTGFVDLASGLSADARRAASKYLTGRRRSNSPSTAIPFSSATDPGSGERFTAAPAPARRSRSATSMAVTFSTRWSMRRSRSLIVILGPGRGSTALLPLRRNRRWSAPVATITDTTRRRSILVTNANHE